MKILNYAFIAILVSGTFLMSCKKDSEKKEVKLRFIFSHYVGEEMLTFDTIKYTNAFGNTYSVATLKYFVSDFVLTKTDGSRITFDQIHYVDATDATTTTFEPTLLLPQGQYQSLSFVYGLNEEKNVTGAFTNPPEVNMEWPLPMGGGYHYMKLEGKFDSVNLVKNFQAHSGRLMEQAHFISISINDLSLTVSDLDKTIELKMDVNKWWDTPNVLDLNNISGIMGNEAIQQQLQENGLNIYSYETY